MFRLRFGLLVTPVKPLDPAHWGQRYYHAHVVPDTAVQSGANIINIHHGNDLNPNINYPFLAVDKLKLAGDNGVARFMLDGELGQRTFVPPAGVP